MIGESVSMNEQNMVAVFSGTPMGVDGLSLGQAAKPRPAAGSLRVRVHACGLAFPDLLMLDDRYQSRPQRPFIPGMEVAGEIDAVGDGVTEFAIGERVFGFVPIGGLAQYAIVPVANCVRMPAAMPYDHGAGFTSTYATAYHALKQRADLRAGESLVVLGASGGVGLAAVQIGKAMGARVIAAASNDDKLAVAMESGADEGIVYPRELDADGGRALTARLKEAGGGGVDVVCDIVGGAYTEAALRALAWQGRLLVVGFPAGIASVPMNLPLLKGASIVGVFCGSFMEKEPEAAARNFSELMALYEAGAIEPLTSASFPLDRCAEAFGLLARREALGKIVVTMP